MNQPTAAEARDRLRSMALSLATGSGPLVEPSAFDAALDAYRDALLAEPAVSSAEQAPATNHTSAPAVWIDGHPQLEAIAAAVWEQCRTEDSSLVVDDPRNIAVAALAAVLPAPTDPAATLRWAADRIDNEELPHDYVDMFDNGARWAAKLLRRLADETPDTQTPSMRLARQSVQAMTGTLQQPCPPGCVACATDESHDPEPAAGARQDGDQT